MVTILEVIADLPELQRLRRWDLRDALRECADATLDGDSARADVWAAVAARTAGELLRLESQLALVDRYAARMLDSVDSDGAQ